MKIGLIDVDNFGRPKKFGATVYPNLALCKISAWHKSQGDQVEWYDPMFTGHCDQVYMSRVFNFTPDFPYPVDADEVVKGGTGYSLTAVLPQVIDDQQPDLSIYPNVPKGTSYGFLTRGCPNECKWCVVSRKEGRIVPYWDIDRVANGRQNVVLMDNNILASGDWCREQLTKIIDRGYRIDFNQALDARLVTDEWARLLARIKWIDKRIRFGCDTPGQIKECKRAIDLITSYGFKGEFFLYTMLQGDFLECFARVNYWREQNQKKRQTKVGNSVFPYAQPYRDPYDPTALPPQWQKDLARWTNNKALFELMDFREYEPRKGFKCSLYFEK